MLPSSMYRKDKTAQHSTLSPQSLIFCTWYVLVYLYRCIFAFFIDCPLGPRVFFLRKLHPYCRSERDIASKHTAQHRAISSGQVAFTFIKSFVAPNRGPLLSTPFTFCCILPCASVAAVVSRPRIGALVTTVGAPIEEHVRQTETGALFFSVADR